MPVVKIRPNRQITIPKHIFEELGLKEGEFVEVARIKDTVVVKPKKLVDRQRVFDEEQWVMNLIRETKEEQAGNPMSEEEMLKESERLAHYGAQQAKKLGIKPKDIESIIHAARTRRNA